MIRFKKIEQLVFGIVMCRGACEKTWNLSLDGKENNLCSKKT